MRKFSRRTTVLVTLGAMAIPLGATAVAAYACTAVATLSETPASAVAGTPVTVTGAFFGVHDPTTATTNGPVDIRLGSLSGPVLAEVTPSGGDRSFSAQVTIPATATPGETFFVATQLTSTGTPVFGTPARQAFTVTAPAAPATPFYAAISAPVVTVPCVVPSVEGMAVSGAESMLIASHCAVGSVTAPRRKGSASRGSLVVASSGPAAGTMVANGTKVDLTLRRA